MERSVRRANILPVRGSNLGGDDHPRRRRRLREKTPNSIIEATVAAAVGSATMPVTAIAVLQGGGEEEVRGSKGRA
jgi:hypothetical protein